MAVDLVPLADIRAERARLDEREAELIDRARRQGATWTQIADTLGLASRQAAQQRHQRLIAAGRSRRHDRDLAYAPGIAALRAALLDLDRWLAADRRWETRFARAGLVRATTAAALDAAPGALYALAAHIAADLAGAGSHRLPTPVRSVAAALDEALSTKH
jgi:hypothetical protein